MSTVSGPAAFRAGQRGVDVDPERPPGGALGIRELHQTRGVARKSARWPCSRRTPSRESLVSFPLKSPSPGLLDARPPVLRRPLRNLRWHGPHDGGRNASRGFVVRPCCGRARNAEGWMSR